MAAQPKKRQAKSRTRRRKTTKKISLPTTVKCQKCASLRIPHRVCPKCGNYDSKSNKQVSEAKKLPKSTNEKGE